MESIKERNKLVDKLIEVITQEWNELKYNFIQECCQTFDSEYLGWDEINEDVDDNCLKEIGVKSTVLAWVKSKIIDNNGAIFRRYHMADNNIGKAIFWVDTETIKILLHNKDFIIRILHNAMKDATYHFYFDFLNYDETRISDAIISVLERVMYHKEMGKNG